MRDHWISGFMTVASLVVLVVFLAAPSAAASQTQQGGTRESGRAARPMPPVPRLPDGTPNLGWVDPAHKGVWKTERIRDYTAQLIERKEEGIPYQPWAKALFEYRTKTQQKDDPEGFCLPPGGVSATTNRTSAPWEFLQMPEQKRIIRIFEGGSHMWQVIYMDGRRHPQEAFDLPTWMGHSVGHWDGDTLVVDTVGFNEGNWLSTSGDVRTSQHHLIERFTRADYNTLRYEATIDDPGAYTRPFKIGWNLTWTAGGELTEVVCTENNKYPNLYPDEEVLLKQLQP
jgi:hypothetical protein